MNYANVFKKKETKQIELKLDLLTIEQIKSLEIFEKTGRKAVITDFSVALGGNIINFCYNDEILILNDKTGCWWSKSPLYAHSCDVSIRGDIGHSNLNVRDIGLCPTLPYSVILPTISNTLIECGILEVEFGEYPQWACSNDLSKLLEKLYEDDKLNKTGKVYTTDSRHYDEYDKGFESQEHIEYEYNGKKYVRVKINSCFYGKKFILSNGEKYKDGDFVWISVSPIKWLVDEKNDIAITKNIIVAGIQFNKENNYTGDNFDEMNIKVFMDKYLSKEIIPGIINYKINNEIKEEKTLEQQRQEKLKEYGLDEESLKEFRSKIHYDEFKNESNFNDLIDSIENNDIKKVEKLIKEGTNINKNVIKDERHGNIGIIKAVSLLNCAIEEKNLDMAILLLKAGHEMDINNMESALYSDMYELCKIMILMGIDLTEETIPFGETIFEIARFSKQEKYIKLFENAVKGDYSIIFDEDNVKDILNTKKDVIQTGIEEMEKMIESCEELLGEDYQKKLIK